MTFLGHSREPRDGHSESPVRAEKNSCDRSPSRRASPQECLGSLFFWFNGERTLEEVVCYGKLSSLRFWECKCQASVLMGSHPSQSPSPVVPHHGKPTPLKKQRVSGSRLRTLVVYDGITNYPLSDTQLLLYEFYSPFGER